MIDSFKQDYQTAPDIKKQIDEMDITDSDFSRESGYSRNDLTRYFSGQIPINEFDALCLKETIKRFRKGKTKLAYGRKSTRKKRRENAALC